MSAISESLAHMLLWSSNDSGKEPIMNIKSIKQGSIVETTMGVGLVKRVGGTHPPSVQVVITPIPRGLCTVRPRDVSRELSDAEVAELRAQGLNLG